MTAALALSPAPGDAPSLADKPQWWLADVERLTREHREARAAALELSGTERYEEAWEIRTALLEGARDELGTFVGRPNPQRALPGGTPEVHRVLRQWDRELYVSSRGARRLLRGDFERTEDWQARVFAECDRRIESKWHQARAAGQRERFRKVAECGTELRGYLVCSHCRQPARTKTGAALVLRDTCDAHLLCARCRARRTRKYQSKILRSRAAALELVHDKRLGPGQVRSDPLRERFLTLTCPHLPLDAGGPELQAALVRDAWSRFINSLRNHWRGHRGLKLCRFVRVLEATTGKDDLGHVHCHVWLLAPFVRVQVIRALWGRALIAAGFPLELWPEQAWKEKADILAELEAARDVPALIWAHHVLSQRTPWPVVDLQAVRGNGAEMVRELVKYLCKDVVSMRGDGDVVFMHPELFAAVYRGLDAGRLLTASLGFWVRYHATCACCGAVDTLRPVEELRPIADARAPPLLALVRPAG